jgi:hypothetical protein
LSAVEVDGDVEVIGGFVGTDGRQLAGKQDECEEDEPSCMNPVRRGHPDDSVFSTGGMIRRSDHVTVAGSDSEECAAEIRWKVVTKEVEPSISEFTSFPDLSGFASEKFDRPRPS